MIKRGLIFGIILLSLFSIGLISAQTALTDFLSTFDPSTIVLSILFVIFFTVLYFATSKMFKGNKAVPAVISIGISLLIVYGISTSNIINVQGIFSGFGISNDVLYTVGSILFVVFLIFIFIKLKSWAFYILGGILIGLAASGLIYSQSAAIIIGLILIGVGVVFTVKKKAKINPSGGNSRIKTKVIKEKQEESRGRNELSRAQAMATAGQDYVKNAEALSRKWAAQKSQELQDLQTEYNRLLKEYNQIRNQDPSNDRLNNLINDVNSVRAEINKLKETKNPSESQESSIKSEVNAIENRSESDEQQAMQEERRDIASTKTLQIEQREETRNQLLIGSDIKSLMNSYNQLQSEYDELIKINPQDPKLQEIYNEMVNTRNEIQRLRSQK